MGAVVVAAAPSRHTAVHTGPSPCDFLSEMNITLRPFLAAFPLSVIGSGLFVWQYLYTHI